MYDSVTYERIAPLLDAGYRTVYCEAREALEAGKDPWGQSVLDWSKANPAAMWQLLAFVEFWRKKEPSRVATIVVWWKIYAHRYLPQGEAREWERALADDEADGRALRRFAERYFDNVLCGRLRVKPSRGRRRWPTWRAGSPMPWWPG